MRHPLISFEAIDRNIAHIESGRNGWAFKSPPVRASYCPWNIVLVEKSTGRPFVVEKLCGSWYHQSCAHLKARSHLIRLGNRFDECEQIWVSWTTYDPKLPERLRQRRYARDGDYCWVRRTDDTVFIFSNVDLSGRKDPVEGYWVAPFAALLFAVAGPFRLPGIAADEKRKGVSYGGRWRQRSAVGYDAEHQDDDSDKAEDERVDDERSYAFCFMSGRVPDIHRATRVAAWLMSRRYKVEVTANDPLPPDIPRDEWVDQIKAILEALRERSRRQG